VNREPTLDDLIGADMSGEERERLRQVHGMLLEAGPPPELSPKLEEGPTLGMTLQRKRALKRRAMLLLAATLAVVGVFLGGYAVANRGGSGPTPVLSQALKGTTLAPRACRSIRTSGLAALLRAFLAERRARVEPRAAAATETEDADPVRRDLAMNGGRVTRQMDVQRDQERRPGRPSEVPSFDPRDETT